MSTDVNKSDSSQDKKDATKMDKMDKTKVDPELLETKGSAALMVKLQLNISASKAHSSVANIEGIKLRNIYDDLNVITAEVTPEGLVSALSIGCKRRMPVAWPRRVSCRQWTRSNRCRVFTLLDAEGLCKLAGRLLLHARNRVGQTLYRTRSSEWDSGRATQRASFALY